MKGTLFEALGHRWNRLLGNLGAPVDPAELAFTGLCRHYTDPGRYYHDLKHIAAVLDSIDRLCTPPPALELAAWLHDVIYDPKRHDNEALSADYARSMQQWLDLPAAITDEAARLVLLTRSHEADEKDHSGRVLLDADLSVLGAQPEEYDRYAEAIRQEYAWVPETEYRTGRARILENFLRRPRLFQTQSMYERSEVQARENLGREIVLLRG